MQAYKKGLHAQQSRPQGKGQENYRQNSQALDAMGLVQIDLREHIAKALVLHVE
jgi:hypothetical protein